jgi:hypothetical protein
VIFDGRQTKNDALHHQGGKEGKERWSANFSKMIFIKTKITVNKTIENIRAKTFLSR